jgi:hypothetical protein
MTKIGFMMIEDEETFILSSGLLYVGKCLMTFEITGCLTSWDESKFHSAIK